MSEPKLELKSMLTRFCGPHCGMKDGKEGHCQNCHNQTSHGNVARTEQGWEARLP